MVGIFPFFAIVVVVPARVQSIFVLPLGDFIGKIHHGNSHDINFYHLCLVVTFGGHEVAPYETPQHKLLVSIQNKYQSNSS